MKDLNEKQNQSLKSLLRRVQDVLEPQHDDYYVLRFLKARNFNDRKAEIMLRKSIKWHKQMRIRNFLDHYKAPEVLKKYHPGGFVGHDKEGCPVWILNAEFMDIRGLLESCRQSDFIKYQISRYEIVESIMREQSRKLNRRIEHVVYIFDIENLTISETLNKPALEALLNSFRAFEANYPETLKKCFVINAPKLFHLLWAFIKPIFGDETAKKIAIFGKEGWQKAVLETIDASVLPVHWGGTRIDPITKDSKCSTVVYIGGIVPESYYFSNQRRLTEKTDVHAITVPRRNFFDVITEVNKIGSILEWEVETEENDLAIGLYYKESRHGVETEELVPCIRAETGKIFEPGSFECDKTGIYLLRLDNTFSWFIAKKVTYRICLELPLENEV